MEAEGSTVDSRFGWAISSSGVETFSIRDRKGVTAMAPSTRVPVVDADSAPYWAAVERGELAVPRCERCVTYVFYPRAHCPVCRSTDLTWTTLAGTGTVYSLTVSRRAPSP